MGKNNSKILFEIKHYLRSILEKSFFIKTMRKKRENEKQSEMLQEIFN